MSEQEVLEARITTLITRLDKGCKIYAEKEKAGESTEEVFTKWLGLLSEYEKACDELQALKNRERAIKMFGHKKNLL